MTVERLSDPACHHRIATPTPRKQVIAAASRPEKAIEPPIYIQSRGLDGNAKTVRLVGSRFLQKQDEIIDFRARNAENAGVVSRFFFATADYLGLSGESRIAEVGKSDDTRQIAEAPIVSGGEDGASRATF